MSPQGKAGQGGITPSFQPTQTAKRAPCQEGCPNCGDIRGWIGTIAQRHKLGLTEEEAFDRAWAIIADVNPFLATLGRVCPHPCEARCNRAAFDAPVSINALERFLGDWGIERRLALPRLAEEPRPEWVGLVGAGPSGLSFACQMARRGYRVTAYEAKEQAGGMLRYGIPDYRLPQGILDAEIRRILELGVELELACAVGRDVTFEELRHRHAALYVGIGAQAGRGLGVPGEDVEGVWTGTDYLGRVNRGEAVDLGRSVVVVGGGNTAVDAARTARRTGAEVTILYRRSREEMPAFAPEIEEALEEGVKTEFLAAPVRLVGTNGRLDALVARRMELGPPDESGRRRPVPIPGSHFELPVSSVIAAVSQSPAWEGFQGLPLEDGWLVAGSGGALDDKVWAGGDALGLGIAAEAVVHGRRAAEAVDAKFRGLPPEQADPRPSVGPDRILYGFHGDRRTARPAHLEPAARLADPTSEVSQGITREQVLEEAARCFSCGDCFGCQQCWMFCTSGCFTKVEERERGAYFTVSLDACERCGKCVEVCPCGYLDVR